ncbi:hypothetical protein ACF0H5_018222 [Mactra antiquata]
MGSCSSKEVIFPRQNHSAEEVRYLESSKARIDRYFHLLYNTITGCQTHEEVIHVRDGVEKLVQDMVGIVGEMDDRFYVKDNKLMKVGSFYEGTNLGRANQFDYVVTIDAIEPEFVEMVDLNDMLGDTNVAVFIDKLKFGKFISAWKTMIVNSFLIGKMTSENNTTGILDVFLKRVRKALKVIKTKETKFGRIEVDLNKETVIDGSGIKLYLTLTKDWHEIEDKVRIDKCSKETIYVTVTPAIEITDVKKYVLPDDCLDEKVHNELVKTGHFLLIAAEDGNFKKAFTVTETKLIKTLSERHFKTFCIVKFLFNGIDENELMTTFRGVECILYNSQVLKMLMLKYSQLCTCSEYTEFELFDCVAFFLNKILESLNKNSDTVWILCDNVFMKKAKVVISDSGLVELHKAALTEMIKHELKYWIGEKEKYDFNKRPKQYGVTPLTQKMYKMLETLNPDV